MKERVFTSSGVYTILSELRSIISSTKISKHLNSSYIPGVPFISE